MISSADVCYTLWVIWIKKYREEFVIVVLLLLAIFIWHAVWHEVPTATLTIAFMSIGQGDAIFIESPTRNRMIIDGGPGPAIVSEVATRVPWYVRSIDLVLVTHPDADHFVGFIDLLQHYHVGALVESGVFTDSTTYKKFINRIVAQDGDRVSAQRGTIIDLGGGAILQILFPDRDPTHMKTNDASLVAQLIYGSTTVMLTGDSPKSIEEYLVTLDGPALKSDILKVAHHGSKNSGSESFTAAVAPDVAVISSGKNNSYGHPHPELVALLQKFIKTILNTADEGTIVFKSDGQHLYRVH